MGDAWVNYTFCLSPKTPINKYFRQFMQCLFSLFWFCLRVAKIHRNSPPCDEHKMLKTKSSRSLYSFVMQIAPLLWCSQYVSQGMDSVLNVKFTLICTFIMPVFQSLKFWRSRFLLLPCVNPATKKIIDGHKQYVFGAFSPEWGSIITRRPSTISVTLSSNPAHAGLVSGDMWNGLQ